MSRKIPSYVLLLFITLLYTVTAAPLSSPDIDSFVPSCAAQCFDSFLTISYADHPARTLAALCPRIGAYGFTIGEAAVQCLAAERAAGACSQQVASDAVIDKAYYMCDGQPGALLPTHTVITATLAVPLHGTGPITFPPVPKTTTNSIPTAIPKETQTSLSLPTTLLTDPTSLAGPVFETRPIPTVTSTPTTKPSSTSFKTFTSSSAAVLTTRPVVPTFAESSTSASATSTSTDVPDGVIGTPGEKKASAPLNTAQVAGIAFGCIVGAGAIGIAAALFCRRHRKKRYRFRRRMRKDGRPLRDSWGFGTEKGPNGGGGTDSWIVNQLRAPLPTPKKSWYNRPEWRSSAIGMAISPGRTGDAPQATTPTSTRPLSKLLPAKPVMDQGPPRLEVSLPSRDGGSHLDAAAFVGAAAAGAAAGVVMSGAIAAPKPAAQPVLQAVAKPVAQLPAKPAVQVAKPPLAQPVQPAKRAPAMTGPSIQPRSLTPPGQPQSPLPLKLIIPKTGNVKPFVPVITRHDSSTTEFEEDGRTSLSPSGQIWRPPSDDPLTATPYYVADRSGNWRLGDPARAQEIAELEASVSPLTAAPRSAAPKLVAGLGLATGAAGALALVQAANRRQDSRAAAEAARQTALGVNMPPEQTIRAVAPSISSDEEIQEQERQQQPYAPRPLFYGNANGGNNNNNNNNLPRRSSTHRRSSTRSLTRPRIMSTDSGVTDISVSSDDTDLRSPPPLEQAGNLSPVVESPRSQRPIRGQSPTQYPKIPASLNATAAAAAGPSKLSMSGDRPAQPSPSMGAPLGAGTMSSHSSNMPRQQAKKTVGFRTADPAPDAVRTGSPMMRPEASAASRPDERYNQAQQQQQPNAPPRTYYPQQQQQQQQQQPADTRPPYSNYSMPYRLPPHPTAYRPDIESSGYPYQTRLPDYNPLYAPNQNRYPPANNPRNPPFPQQRQQPTNLRPQQQQPNPRPQRQPSLGPQQQQQQQQQDIYFQPSPSSYYPSTIPPGPLPGRTSTSTTTTTSAYSSAQSHSSSSLLAKRLGTSRAATMALPAITPSKPSNNGNNNASSSAKLSSSSSSQKWLRQGQGQSPSTPRMQPPPMPVELPATPVWKPRLTPTRRGDDLFLIAQ